jgi:hypothetical protein
MLQQKRDVQRDVDNQIREGPDVEVSVVPVSNVGDPEISQSHMKALRVQMTRVDRRRSHPILINGDGVRP